MKAFWKLLIAKVLAYLQGIKPDQFTTAVSYVANAERIFTLPAKPTEEEVIANRAAKKTYVMNALKTVATTLGTAALNLLLEMAVSYFKNKESK